MLLRTGFKHRKKTFTTHNECFNIIQIENNTQRAPNMTTTINGKLDAATAASLTELATKTLIANDLGGYTVPTHGLYPFQWN